MELQPRLFDDLPPTREETPVHQLSYPTFAGAENTMWHGRSFYPGKAAPVGGWNPEREDPVHVGTFEAAAHRGLGEHVARPTMRSPGGLANETQETYRPREDLMAAAGTERGTQMLPLRIREGSMSNDPDMPVSDAHANISAGADFDEYGDKYLGELEESGAVDEATINAAYDGEPGAWEEVEPPSLPETGGLYYRNEHEDPGSISAVVPSAKDLQHWPSEVMKNSTNPAQRRTAEFLLGRGY